MPSPLDYFRPHPASPPSPPAAGAKNKLGISPPMKGRSAELRNSSPARRSPLRQQLELGNGSSEGKTSIGDTDGRFHLLPPSPAHHDHHARAERQGLPADAFIPPPTPPVGEVMFRKPVGDYFSSPPTEIAWRPDEKVAHVADHYQNSPLCPLHPKYRGGQGVFCPLHGPLKRPSDGSIDDEELPEVFPFKLRTQSRGRSATRSRSVSPRSPAP